MGRGAAAALGATVAGILACAGSPDPALIEAYRTQRDEALSTPRGEPARWDPDVVLHLNRDTVEAMVEASLQVAGEWSTVLTAGKAELEPKLTVTELSLSKSDACDTCLGVQATLDGKTRYDAGIAGRGRVPTTIDLSGAVRIDTESTGDGWRLTVAPEDIDDLDLRLPGLPKVVRDLAKEPLLSWVRTNLLDDFEPVEVAELGGDDLSLRALRVIPQGRGGVRIEALTDAARVDTVPIKRPKASVPFKLDIHQTSLLWLARREAFAAGALEMGIVAVPERLEVEDRAFTLHLRLWRTAGSGWWRDYEVTGDITAKKKRIELEPRSVDEIDASPGAVRADPLAALAQSVILRTIEDAVTTSLPTRAQTTVAGVETKVILDHVHGSGGVLSIEGELTISTK